MEFMAVEGALLAVDIFLADCGVMANWVFWLWMFKNLFCFGKLKAERRVQV